MSELIKNTDIFCVEDDIDFAFLMETAVLELKEQSTMQIVDNGKDALRILHKLAGDRQRPRLILLDLNLPGISGIDILKEIRSISYLRYTAVVLFSTSDNIKDIEQSFEFGANAYVTKPSSYSDLITCLQSFEDFWLHQNAYQS
jgi:CheY-like chemotaxis protein